jgi:hypothetical protein
VNNSNQNSSNSSNVLVYKGAITASAASASRRILGHTIFRWGTIGIVGDVYELCFGQMPVPTITPTATVATFSKGFAPVVIGPGQSFCLTQWEASQSTAPTHSLEMGFVVR